MKISIPIQGKIKLLIVKSSSFDVYKNFKRERELFELIDKKTFVLFLWRNNPSVVIGKFQDERYEINLSYIRRKSVPVVRRITGGGTVYHDRGTLNISFLKERDINLFSKYFLEEGRGITEIILKSIRDLGIDGYMGKRNSIFVDGKKVVGSAMAVKGNKFLYHASILVSTDIEELKKVIKWDEDYPEGTRNVVKSVRSEVSNLTDFKKIDIEKFENRVLENFISFLRCYAKIYSGGNKQGD